MKKNLYLIILSAILTTISVIAIFTLNLGLITNLIVGSECQYDANNIETSWLFDLFYTISSDTGYHPEPSYFNLIFTLCIGLMVGVFASLLLFHKNWKK